MNERVKELAEQAREYIDSVCDPRSGVFNGKEYLEAVEEKFAELIVKEACLVLEAGKPGVDQVPAEIALDMMQKNLRAYFGVEK